jgi:ATP adenylyltransferase
MKYVQNSNQRTDCFLCSSLLKPDGLENLVVWRLGLTYVILNQFPYTTGHLLIVPNLHIANLHELDLPTRSELMELTSQSTQVLTEVYHPQGFNIGINIGEVAGAGVKDHLHIHVVPRWGGDTNFMSVLADTRVIPEDIEITYRRVYQAFQRFPGGTDNGIKQSQD